MMLYRDFEHFVEMVEFLRDKSGINFELNDYIVSGWFYSNISEWLRGHLLLFERVVSVRGKDVTDEIQEEIDRFKKCSSVKIDIVPDSESVSITFMMLDMFLLEMKVMDGDDGGRLYRLYLSMYPKEKHDFFAGCGWVDPVETWI